MLYWETLTLSGGEEDGCDEEVEGKRGAVGVEGGYGSVVKAGRLG